MDGNLLKKKENTKEYKEKKKNPKRNKMKTRQ